MTRALVITLLLVCAPLAAASAQETSSKGYIEMPKADDGAWVLTSRPGSGRNWGKPVFIRFLALVAREWRRRHPELPRLRLGDLSKPDGSDFPPHKTHKDGLTADIFTTPQNICHINYPNQNYTLELAQLMVDYGAKQILYNGKLVLANVPIARKWPKHDDHFHVVIDPKNVPDDGAPLVFADTPADGGWVSIDSVKPDLSGLKLKWRVLGKTKLKECQIIFDDLAEGGTPLHDSGPLRPKSSSYKLPITLRDGQTYRWRCDVEASDGSHATTGWQTVRTDFTRPQVTAVGPKDDAEFDLPPKLRWTFKKVGLGQASYKIEIDGDSNHRKIKKTLGPFKSVVNHHPLEQKDLKRVKKYFWRVVAVDSHGNEGASEWNTFKTGRMFGKATRERTKDPGGKPKRVKGGEYGRVHASRLNMREGPNINTTVLKVLRMNAEVRILKRGNEWTKIEILGPDDRPIVGWASSRYIKDRP